MAFASKVELDRGVLFSLKPISSAVTMELGLSRNKIVTINKTLFFIGPSRKLARAKPLTEAVEYKKTPWANSANLQILAEMGYNLETSKRLKRMFYLGGW